MHGINIHIELNTGGVHCCCELLDTHAFHVADFFQLLREGDKEVAQEGARVALYECVRVSVRA